MHVKEPVLIERGSDPLDDAEDLKRMLAVGDSYSSTKDVAKAFHVLNANYGNDKVPVGQLSTLLNDFGEKVHFELFTPAHHQPHQIHQRHQLHQTHQPH